MKNDVRKTAVLGIICGVTYALGYFAVAAAVEHANDIYDKAVETKKKITDRFSKKKEKEETPKLIIISTEED